MLESFARTAGSCKFVPMLESFARTAGSCKFVPILQWLHEHDAVPWAMFQTLTEDGEGMFRWPDRPWLPLAFSLRAQRA
jgi:hypothetical protein